MNKLPIFFEHGQAPCTGILLANLGTPDAPTPAACRRYLREFLWDPRVIENLRPIWWLILNGIILNVRPKKSAHAYQTIWTEDGSPLLANLRQQAQKLAAELKFRFAGEVKVEAAMRYGNPSIYAGMQQLAKEGAQRILVFPLYPQYSAATTASTFDAVAAYCQKQRWMPELRFINSYHDDPGVIAALARSIREYWQAHDQPELLLFSFHGMPKFTLSAGDPYYCQCQKTARLVAEGLGLKDNQWRVVFQSLFGKLEWLKPYAADTLACLPEEGTKKVDVVCPGFSADCLETLEEMAIQNRALFLEAGGRQYRYIPALNARDDHISALADLVVRHTQGWYEATESWNSVEAQGELEESVKRARAMGAPN